MNNKQYIIYIIFLYLVTPLQIQPSHKKQKSTTAHKTQTPKNKKQKHDITLQSTAEDGIWHSAVYENKTLENKIAFLWNYKDLKSYRIIYEKNTLPKVENLEITNLALYASAEEQHQINIQKLAEQQTILDTFEKLHPQLKQFGKVQD
jgi:hypothetical protein